MNPLYGNDDELYDPIFNPPPVRSLTTASSPEGEERPYGNRGPYQEGRSPLDGSPMKEAFVDLGGSRGSVAVWVDRKHRLCIPKAPRQQTPR